MPNTEQLEHSMPVAAMKLLAPKAALPLAEKINYHLVEYRRSLQNNVKNDPAFHGYMEDNYLMEVECPRFGTGEGKAILRDSVRGKDIFLLTDVCNHSITYNMNGFTNYMSPDDHYQDLKRIISAINGKAHRINVIMPFLYEGRQHKRNGRESLDCAYAIKELMDMGVSNFITFDAHDPRVQNSVPIKGFDNFMPPYQFIRALLRMEKNLIIDKDHTIVISPDEGALDRAVYLANVLGVDTGMFYKRRDYSTIVNGKNPIVAHEFLGDNIDGKDVIVIDDMISSGGSMIDTARQLKKMNAKRVFICCTFGLFTNGLEKFDDYYQKGYIDYVITTNLNYRPQALLEREWYLEADMSKYLAAIINNLNHDVSLDRTLSPTRKIQKLVRNYTSDGYEYFQMLR